MNCLILISQKVLIPCNWFAFPCLSCCALFPPIIYPKRSLRAKSFHSLLNHSVFIYTDLLLIAFIWYSHFIWSILSYYLSFLYWWFDLWRGGLILFIICCSVLCNSGTMVLLLLLELFLPCFVLSINGHLCEIWKFENEEKMGKHPNFPALIFFQCCMNILSVSIRSFYI